MTPEELEVLKFEAIKADNARLEKIAKELEIVRLANPPLIDHDLPKHDLVPDKEWVYPGHSEEYDLGPDEKHFLGKSHPTHNTPRDPKATKGAKRKLLRLHHLVDWRGKRRACYVMIWRYGLHGDCFHTYIKNFPNGSVCWTKEEADAFHAERMAHGDWSKPAMDNEELMKFRQMALEHDG